MSVAVFAMTIICCGGDAKYSIAAYQLGFHRTG